MSLHTDRLYIGHIRDAAQRALRYTLGYTADRFAEEELVQDGVIRQLEIIGEAVARVSPHFRAQHPDWPWASMRAMRNHLAHGYAHVRLDTVWDTVAHDLPRLAAMADAALEELTQP